MIRGIATRAAVAVSFLAAGARADAQQTSRIDTLAMRAHTRVLAHDSLLGRAAGTAGERSAAHYIAAQCSTLGLAPLGASYLHPIPLTAAELLPTTHLVVRTAVAERRFDFPGHIVPEIGTRRTLDGFTGRAVWVGHADSIANAALGRVGLDGQVAVMLGMAGPAAMEALTARGVAGVISIAPSDETFRLYRQSRGERRLHHRDPEVTSSLLSSIPVVIVDIEVARAILATDGPEARVPSAAGPLGTSVELAMATKERPTTSWNVGCALQGTEPAAEASAVAFTAHLDHLGVGPPDTRGDSIYNGFSDNAAGASMLLAIAQAATASRPARSWLFLFFGAEEQGLLGSDHFVHDPAWPLERIRAVINLDAGAPPAPPLTWRLAGVDSNGLGAVASGVARRNGWQVTTSPPKPNSDYFPFVRMGVPAVFIIPGPGAYEGLSADSSNALRRRWDWYHQAGDEWHPDFPFSGLERYATFALLLARALDTPPREP